MAALPYMPLYVADYMADAAHLSTVQHGAYLLLIMTYWQRGGPLPDDDAKLARICRMGPREFERHKSALSEFFQTARGNWSHKRIDIELARVADKSLKSRKAGLTSAERRSSARSTDEERTSNHTDTDTSNTLAKANGAGAPDSDKAFWDTAKSFLKSEAKDPGALIGKWVRDRGKQPTADALTRAQIERPVQRIAFIEGCLKQSKVEQPVIGI